jgi:endonuclease YncB( thermonuclease family)
MAKAIEQLPSGITVGHAGLGYRSGVAGSVRQEVHDGDTIVVRALGNFGVRFLAVDAPEISFPLPGKPTFIGLSDPRWDHFLANPFDGDLPPFDPPLSQGLRQHLKARVGGGTALNHYRHAAAAEDLLEEEVQKDLNALNQSEEDFQFFLAFAGEVMDRYGRLLGYINRHQPDPLSPEVRPPSYNERLLRAASVTPYFIWPNIDPFRRQSSPVKAVIPPGKANQVAEEEEALSQARQWVRTGRQEGLGIFAGSDPLKLLPFEVRFLARRVPPDRWVIDLGKDDDVLIKPQRYYTIVNMEDRLFIPEEYVPLFAEKGWKKQK